MNCPLFIDFTRECMDEVGYCPQDTLEFCTTEKYLDCPFYQVIKKQTIFCEYIKQCPVCRHFTTKNFNDFQEMAGLYCLSENMIRCQRYILRKAGQNVPPDLLPDGTRLNK